MLKISMLLVLLSQNAFSAIEPLVMVEGIVSGFDNKKITLIQNGKVIKISRKLVPKGIKIIGGKRITFQMKP